MTAPHRSVSLAARTHPPHCIQTDFGVTAWQHGTGLRGDAASRNAGSTGGGGGGLTHALQSRNKPCKTRLPIEAGTPGHTPCDTAGSIRIDREALIFMRLHLNPTCGEEVYGEARLGTVSSVKRRRHTVCLAPACLRQPWSVGGLPRTISRPPGVVSQETGAGYSNGGREPPGWGGGEGGTLLYSDPAKRSSDREQHGQGPSTRTPPAFPLSLPLSLSLSLSL